MIKVLVPETLNQIAALVRSGFYDRNGLMEIFCEEIYPPGELEPAEVSAAIDAESEKWESEKATWPAVTDCDRLDSAFAALGRRGVIALHNAGYTQSDGYDDFCEAYANQSDKSAIRGYCFYHGQDLERAVRGEGLWLAFDPVDAKDEKTKGPEIGNMVRDELEHVGFKVNWDGTFAMRIQVADLVWQRR